MKTIRNDFRLFTTALMVMALTAAIGCPHQPEIPQSGDVEYLKQSVLGVENAMNLSIDALNCAIPEAGNFEPAFVVNGSVIRSIAEVREICKDMMAPRSGAVFKPDRITVNLLSNEAAFVTREGNYTISYKDGTSTVL